MGNKDQQQRNISSGISGISGISQIVLKNAATFDENGASFEKLNFINFIYGANGSGKTTTSSFLKNLAENRDENGDKNKFANSEIKWYGENLKIEVYNKQFKEEQFRNSQVKGIFTLGKKTNENLENIEGKRESINKENEKKTKNEKSLQKLKQEREEKEKDFTDSCWEKLYKKNEEDFKETLEGFKLKKKFKEKILEEFKNNEHNESEIVKLEKLKENIRIVFSKNQTKLVPLECNLTDFDSVENHSIWEQKIVGSGDVAIADLIKKLSNEDWVAQGREYLSKDNNACPFCQQETITEEFKKQLESYFDTSYQESTETIKKMKENYTNKTARALEQLDKIVETEQKNQQTKLNTESFKRIIETLRSKINGNWQKMHDKNKEMSRSFKLESTKNEIKEIRDLIDTANQQIANHNEMIKDIQNQKKICVEQTWKFLVNEFKSDIQEYNKKHCGLEKGIKKLENEISEIKGKIEELENEISEIEGKIKEFENEIRELEKTMVSIKPIVKEINAFLKGYGFTNFSLAYTEDEKFYRIQREDGQLVGETLSEGEVTFITFLYYYHLTKGSLKENDISKNKVLVIDDPISSLDSNILFIVSVLVKDLMKETTKEKTNIKQVIILTHNTYFYKEITLKYDLEHYQGKYSFWIIRKDNNVSKIENFKENPIKNSYELLWQEVRWAKEKQAKENNISWVSLQNVMRRIIEYYFRILGGFKHNDSLSEYFENIEEKQVCNSFISWFNDGSHGISDDSFVQSQDTSIETYLKVFENIFKVTGHEAHYKMMMEPLDKNKE
ncbi:ATP-binding protein [Helicobacter pylori]|uniref:ATP-binding protein n=1 Tax=Helicobacter pylori TaxID=210 RepID=UPI001F180947|nr:AAA family ATPase [Helicobacter pylori]